MTLNNLLTHSGDNTEKYYNIEKGSSAKGGNKNKLITDYFK